jgi:hypothetical protein
MAQLLRHLTAARTAIVSSLQEDIPSNGHGPISLSFSGPPLVDSHEEVSQAQEYGETAVSAL